MDGQDNGVIYNKLQFTWSGNWKSAGVIEAQIWFSTAEKINQQCC